MIRKFLAPLLACLALACVAAAPASATFTSAYVNSYTIVSSSCKQTFPSTCQGITLDAYGGPYYDYNFNSYFNFHYHFFGYYGSRRVRCDTYISMWENGAYKGQYSAAKCVYA